jgi:hypothetical protein
VCACACVRSECETLSENIVAQEYVPEANGRAHVVSDKRLASESVGNVCIASAVESSFVP